VSLALVDAFRRHCLGDLHDCCKAAMRACEGKSLVNSRLPVWELPLPDIGYIATYLGI
jgi:hypothetical protein